MSSSKAVPRERQSSLQDLVNRFNSAKDESLPAPTKLRQGSGGRGSSPVTTRSRATAPKHTDNNSPSHSATGGRTGGSRGPPSTANTTPRKKKSMPDATSPRSAADRSAKAERIRTSVANNPWASHSMTSLHLSQNEAARPPLFGEVRGPAPGPFDLGFGIPNHRRRGSDGSAHLQTPKLHRRSRSDRDVSPSSPTAWYLGLSPSLDQIDVNRNAASPTRRPHRRARSDLTGDPHISAGGARPEPPTPMALPTPEASPNASSKSTPRRHNLSKIPISTRRGSNPSDSGASTPSTRSNSAMGRPGTPTGGRFARAKGASSIREPHQKTFHREGVRPVTPAQLDPRLQAMSPAQLDPRLQAMSPTRPGGTSPRLKAYITAPLPKKSPPLRSSRPRQPVSTATTSASRSRVVDRYDPQATQDRASSRPQRPARDGRDGKDSKAKPKHIPELGSVDFAARRERIQRAFTISMREKEKHDQSEAARRLERRHAKDRERAAKAELRASKKESGQSTPTNPTPRAEGRDRDGAPKPEHRQQDRGQDQSKARRTPRGEGQLSVDTQLPVKPLSEAALAQRNGVDNLDSPTLGIPGSYANTRKQGHGQGDTEPTSAATTDTAVTPIDNEPQIDPPRGAAAGAPSQHRTVLSQILQFRAADPVSPAPTQFHEDTASELDDKESIQIMLGRTPVDSRHLGGEEHDYATHKRTPDGLTSEQMGSRWSMDSYGSYPRTELSDRERDSFMDRTDGTAASSESTRGTSVERDSQPWVGDEAGATRSSRTTLDSESYSTINKVLEHYHDGNLASPEMFYDFQKQLLTKSPELARQGGWDPKRVTQLYLQELGRGKSFPKRASPESSAKPSTSPSRTLQTAECVPPKEVEPLGTAIIWKDGRDTSKARAEMEAPTRLAPVKDEHRYELSDKAWSAAVSGLEVPSPEEMPMHRASLTGPDDWKDASPSVMDWIHPQAADSPRDNLAMTFRPTPPPKDRESEDPSKPPQQVPDRADARTPRLGSLIPPGLPELETTGGGLGLVLQVDPSQDEPAHATPPLPDHSPPPPPMPAHARKQSYDPFRSVDGIRSPPSPSIYSRNPPSSIFPSVFPEGMAQGVRSRTSEGGAVPSTSHVSASAAPIKPRSASRPAPSKRAQSEQQARRASMTATASASKATADQKRLTKRRFIIKELLDTEKQFHGDMKVTEEIYKGTANACPAVTPEDVKVLFGNIEQIVAFSLDFFDSLRQAAASVYVIRKITAVTTSKRSSVATSHSGEADDPSPSGSHLELTDEEKDKRTFVGEAFGRHMAQIEKVYSEYLKNLEAANKRLQKLQANPGVVLWLNECRSHAEDLTDTWSLDSLIVKPMQRILKYPLLLQALSEVTPEDHPDFTAVDVAVWEMKAVTNRIEDMMKRVDLMEQAVGRKRKESDVRTGISKAFGRRTEKLKQQVGLSEMFDDLEFNRVAEKWDSHVIQLQFSMADVDKYLTEVQAFVDRFLEYVAAIEQYMDVGRSSYPEIESKWRKFGMAMKEVSTVGLTEHRDSVQKSVIGPMKTLVKMYEAPQKIIQKRNKRIMDYARYKGVKDRGDKPDKRLQEQGEQFMAMNDTLKEELPRLYALTGKLAEACLANLVQVQSRWYTVWQEKIKSILDDHLVPRNVAEIVSQFSGDFAYSEAQVNTLGVCNGSILADSVNFLGPQPSFHSDEGASGPNRHGTFTGNRTRTRSFNSNVNTSPIIPPPDFGQRNSGSFLQSPLHEGMPSTSAPQSAMSFAMGRIRANSSHSSQGGVSGPPLTPDMSTNARSFYAMTPATSNQSHNPPVRPSTSTGRSMDIISFNNRRPSGDHSSVSLKRPGSGSTYVSAQPEPRRPSSPSTNGRPFSGLFSSAMPMTDSPRNSPHQSRPSSPCLVPGKAIVMFTVASIEEFNIDACRMEAGYPYLTYVKGEIFDVIGEKGELWLARNQDDRTQTIGWLWNRHCAKLTEAS